MPEDTKSSVGKISPPDNRCETRYACLGIGLFYSLNLEANLDSVGADIYRAQIVDMSLHGLSIDVYDQYPAGEQIKLCIESPYGQREVLLAEVKWCRPIASNNYRLGLQVTSYNGVAEACDRKDGEGCYRHQKQAQPAEIRLLCPACKERVVFAYLDEQEIQPGKHKMTLYNCPACGTTRSITTILQYNRKP